MVVYLHVAIISLFIPKQFLDVGLITYCLSLLVKKAPREAVKPSHFLCDPKKLANYLLPGFQKQSTLFESDLLSIESILFTKYKVAE